MRTFIILGDLYTFPQYDAAAASNRAYAIASGLKANGINTIIVTFSNIYNKYSGFEKGVEFYIPLEQEIRNKYFIIRRFHKIKKYFNALKFLKLQKKTADLGMVILYTRNPYLMLFALFCSHVLSFKIILEVTEFPIKDFKKYSLFKPFFPYTFLPLFDGFSCISNQISDYCNKYKNKKAGIIVVPPLITLNPLEKTIKQNNTNNEYILYSGTLTFKRDGIDILIKAFHLVHKVLPTLQLILGGKWIDDLVKEEAVNLISELKLQDFVRFSGFVSPEEMKSLVLNAKILCVPRKENIETISAFPTKLVEYLATGIPVLTTYVGDISNYIIDSKNGFLAEPDNVESLKDKLIYINNNYKEALKAGKEGEKLAFEKFSNIKCTLGIMDLFAELESQSD